MPAKKTTKPTTPGKMSYEQCIEELEQIIEKIEAGKIGLQESLARRKRGDELIKRCRGILDQADQELTKITTGSKETDND